MKRLIALAASMIMLGSNLQAQSAEDFCATAPADLMSALDGAWTLTHGPGITMTGAGVHAFPAPKPTTLEFTYWRNFGFGVLSGDGQNMVMLPASAQATADYVDDLVAETGIANVTPETTACDWYALPSMIGTNRYSLRGPGPDSFDLSDLSLGTAENMDSIMIDYCVQAQTGNRIVELFSEYGDRTGPQEYTTPAGFVFNVNPMECEHESGSGDMTMTVFLKFDSPNSASGVASFSGDMTAGGRRIRFAAETPVWMTR